MEGKLQGWAWAQYVSSPIPVKVYKAFAIRGPIKGCLAWIFHRIVMGFVLAVYCCASNKQTNKQTFLVETKPSHDFLC